MVRIFRPTEFIRPASVAEAIQVLRARGSDAKVLAGGTSFMVRRPPCKTILDITRLGLGYLRHDGDLRIGATATLDAILADGLVRERYRALAAAAEAVGSLGIRSMATLGGNLCTPSSARDTVPALIALGARVRIAGPEGERELAVEDLTGQDGPELGAGDILTEVIVPAQPSGSGSAFLKLARHNTTIDVALVSAAARLELTPDRVCLAARISLGAAASNPMRLRGAERRLEGRALGAAAIDDTAQIAMQEASPAGDLRGSAGYKREMIRVLVKRALAEAWASAGEAQGR